MAADQEPEIAEDGIQEVPLTIARPLLTRLIEQAREDGVFSALTVRGRRRAYLVTPDFYERAAYNKAFVEAVDRAWQEMSPEDQATFGSEVQGYLYGHPKES
ncbi:hypothetical protein HUF15_00715 [Streptomyces samsunensis]|uniref:type II toxin-antitoxin system Phd/YefM family antitoxin n=1 Tax=Streptomyces malaysiensis TaxID=92644 RepID=UPI0015818289|nr:type II toxin-antitoxin system Phd/YefM family antitoxin [Streptomyces samsunensis]NUH35303.1 hypothetical protein [Streptomyces samsunensis]